jgi:Zn-dependent peptidase ImmA (M78 family)
MNANASRSAVIPPYRSEYIDLKLKEFVSMNDIRRWPLDCIKVLQGMKNRKQYSIDRIGVRDLQQGLDAVTQYNFFTESYEVWFNNQTYRYPYKKSSHRRLNFTAAHEIGHIVLEHLLIPERRKNCRQKRLDELEADEFAARLLMPKNLICSFNYYSLEAVAAWLNVSKTALIHRLIRLNRLPLLSSRRLSSCTRCGNTRFSAFARFCGVCGLSLHRGVKGIRRIYYPDEIPMDAFKRVLVCPTCNKKIHHTAGLYCPFCSTGIFNFCIDFFSSSGDGCSYANPAYARFCEMCGKATDYNKKRFFCDWQEIYCNGAENNY